MEISGAIKVKVVYLYSVSGFFENGVKSLISNEHKQTTTKIMQQVQLLATKAFSVILQNESGRASVMSCHVTK